MVLSDTNDAHSTACHAAVGYRFYDLQMPVEIIIRWEGFLFTKDCRNEQVVDFTLQIAVFILKIHLNQHTTLVEQEFPKGLN